MTRSPALLKNWQRIRQYAVPRWMISQCTAARECGDWRAACAAGGIDVSFDDPGAAEADLLGLAPDLLRWHLPRVLGGRTSLATDGKWILDTGLSALDGQVLVLRTPKTVDGSQRLRLSLESYRSLEKPKPAELPPYLWHAGHAHQLRSAWSGGGQRLPRFSAPGTPLPEESFATTATGEPAAAEELALRLLKAGQLTEAWAAAGFTLDASMPQKNEKQADLARRWLASVPLQLTLLASEASRLRARHGMDLLGTSLNWNLAARLTWADGHWHATLGHRANEISHLPQIQPDVCQFPPDLDLLWAGLMSREQLHPLVREALFPESTVDSVVPSPTEEGPIRVRCQGKWHIVAEANGTVSIPSHTADEVRREAALRGLGGEVTGCFQAAYVWQGAPGRLPKRLRQRRQDLMQCLLHADAPEMHRLLDAGLDPQIRDGRGQGLLHHLRRWDHTTLLPRLLEAGLSIEARDHRQRTPLHVAVSDVGSPALVTALLEAGADPQSSSNDGMAILELAKYKACIWDEDEDYEDDDEPGAEDIEHADIKAIYAILAEWARR